MKHTREGRSIGNQYFLAIVLGSILLISGCQKFVELRHDKTQRVIEGGALTDTALDDFRIGGLVAGVVSVPPTHNLGLSVAFFGDSTISSGGVDSARLNLEGSGHSFPLNPGDLQFSGPSAAPLTAFVPLGMVPSEALDSMLQGGRGADLVAVARVNGVRRTLRFHLEALSYYSSVVF